MTKHIPRSAALLALFAGFTALFLTTGPAPDTNAAPASFRFPTAKDAARSPLAIERQSPLSLTASDGTGLRLVSLDARGVLEGPLAFTELRLGFRNPRPEIIEGRFRITLPPGAAISRFAMKIGNVWQEGEVVERQRARRIYEDFLHRRQDPALLEQQAGNEFTARVFPIPGHAVKELIVSYSHDLERADEPYVIPLLGLPEIDSLDVRVLLGSRPSEDAGLSNLGGTASERKVLELHKSAWTPDRDFEVHQDAAAGNRGLRHENLVVVRVAPEVESTPRDIRGLYILVDSSASRALGYDAQVDLVRRLAAGLDGGAGPSTPLAVAAFDQELTLVYEGTAGGFGTRYAEALRDHRALGASDLEGALRALAQNLTGRRYPRLLLLTDGVATAGKTGGASVGEAVAALRDTGIRRADVLAVGGIRDEDALKRLVNGHLAEDGQVIDGALPLPEIARRLTRSTRSGIRVAVEGASWVWPEELDGVQPWDEFLIYADLPVARPLRVKLDGRAVPGHEPLVATVRPLLERAWVKSRIDRLLHLRDTRFANDPDLGNAMASEVTKLSVEHRVLSPMTAFLVLETDWDYERYGLDRRALADILTVGAGGLEVVDREPSSFRPPPPPRPRPPVRPVRPEVPRPKREQPEPLRLEESVELDAPPDVESEGPFRAETAPENSRIVAQNQSISRLRRQADALGGKLRQLEPARRTRPVPAPPPAPPQADPFTGRYAEVQALLEKGQARQAFEQAAAWNAAAPGNVLALMALGEAAEAMGDVTLAARAYGSLIDLFASRADLRRYAGERLEALAKNAGLALALDTYAKAKEQRPDHPSSHRQLAYALVKSERWDEAFSALEEALRGDYPGGRFRGVHQVLRDDLGLIAAAWQRAEPGREKEITRRLRKAGVALAEQPSLRFVLTWETDANDVDLHVFDGRGAHASYQNKHLPSGGTLYADVTTGYGPECFAIMKPARERAYPYRLEAHYYRRGPMGYGLGTVQIIDHDGQGKLTFDERPFVVMQDGAYVKLGLVKP